MGAINGKGGRENPFPVGGHYPCAVSIDAQAPFFVPATSRVAYESQPIRLIRESVSALTGDEMSL